MSQSCCFTMISLITGSVFDDIGPLYKFSLLSCLKNLLDFLLLRDKDQDQDQDPKSGKTTTSLLKWTNQILIATSYSLSYFFFL